MLYLTGSQHSVWRRWQCFISGLLIAPILCTCTLCDKTYTSSDVFSWTKSESVAKIHVHVNAKHTWKGGTILGDGSALPKYYEVFESVSRHW